MCTLETYHIEPIVFCYCSYALLSLSTIIVARSVLNISYLEVSVQFDILFVTN